MSENSGKYKYLVKNIGLLTLSSFATKLLSFFLVPLYTSILTTTEYGINDLFVTTIGILIPVLTVNIQESVMRFALDKDSDRKSIFSVGLRYIVFGTFAVGAALLVNHILAFSGLSAGSELSNLFDKYGIYFLMMYITQSLSGMILGYIRGIDRIADLSISSVISSAVTIACNIQFLVVFRWGLIGYFWANIIGPFAQCVYLVIRTRIYRDIDLVHGHSDVRQEMVIYSKPMIANSIGWWINNASDKYVVIWFCGLSENGVYSVAGKIPSILNILQSIFAQAWTLTVVKDFDSEDKNGFFAKTYGLYNCVMVLGCSMIIVTDKILAKFLYANDFFAAWKYVPWLTIAIVFGSLAGYIGGFFSAVKNSKIFGTSTMIGAVCNVMLNFFLTPFVGTMGAAIATAVSYCIVWGVRLLHSRKIIKMRIRLGRDIVSYIVLLAQTVVALKVENSVALYMAEIGALTVICLLYAKEIWSAVNKVIIAVKMRLH